jgi:3'-5' exoribonuclease
MTTNVNTLHPGGQVAAGIYLLVNPQQGIKGNGDPYLRCLLRDSTGEVAGRRWTFDPAAMAELSQATVVEVDGDVVEFQGRPQLNIRDIKPRQATPEILASLLPTTSRNIDQMFDAVRALLESVQDPGLRGLADAVLDDEPLMADFRTAPAAISMHHAWIGGLLEHTEQMMKIGDAVVGLYAAVDIALDRDIVLLGLFFHDLAKTSELKWGDGFQYSVRGNLVGHIVDGAALIEAKAAEAAMAGAPSIPDDTLLVLQNIVLSHHGLAEHGAARPPMTPEAVLVAKIDGLEAHVRQAVDAVAGRKRGITEVIRGLGHRLFVQDTRAEG